MRGYELLRVIGIGLSGKSEDDQQVSEAVNGIDEALSACGVRDART